jgi:hypothetical protein
MFLKTLFLNNTKFMEEKNSSGESEEPPNRQSPKIKISKTSLLEPEKEKRLFLLAENVEVSSKIEECFKLWEEFSPKKTLFDSWEFRFAFYLGYQYKPYFLVLKGRPNLENLALLPLWYDETKKKYTWFGSDWQEEVKFFTKNANYIPVLISLAPTPLYLNAIAKESIEPIKDEIKFENDEPKYVLDLEGLRTHEDYLMTLKKNKRRNLRKDRNRILKQNPEIIINNFSDFQTLVELSKKRFQEKGEKTDWEDSRRIKTFEEVIKLAGKSYRVRMITVKIGGKIAGVDLISLYNKTYFALKCGYDVLNFPGIGNFINLLEIDDAIGLKMERIDFLQNSYRWKNQYFKPIPLFKYERN